MTGLADYYCALPVLSHTLDGAFMRSPMLVASIRSIPCETLALAAKLRNSTLFRESLIWVLGPWGDECWEQLEDPKLKKIAKIARHELSHKIAKVQEAIIRAIEAAADDSSLEYFTEYLRDAAIEAREEGPEYLSMPRYFLKLHEKLEAGYVCLDFNDTGVDEVSLDVLMESNLVLEQQQQAGKLDACDHFLCVSIDDEDLPWDTTEMDW